MSLSDTLGALSSEADTHGIVIDWEIVDAAPPFVWVSDFQRDRAAKPGTGRAWLAKLIALAHSDGMAVRLCCTSWNTGLVSYYEALGFRPLFEEGEEVHLEAAPPDQS